MKKIILLALTTLMIMGCNCNTNNTNVRKVDSFYDIHVIEIDSCEYIISNVYHGGQVIIHKQNCRYCNERKQQEMKELTTKLKEE